LRSIAQTLYGDSSLWYEIADANGISGDMALGQGQRLSLPAGVSRTHNNASTLTPYDANSAIGNVSPTTPKPPKKAGCGVLGQILLAVVSIAVTVVLTPVIGPVGAATVGNVVSQGVGIATGIQDKFSFESVALTAVTAAVGQGLDKVGVFSSLGIAGGSGVTGALNAAARGALTSAVSQGIGVATGLQDNFDWSGVAGAAVGAGLSSQIKIGGFGGTVLRNMAGGLANAASRSVINGTDFGDNIIAALPDMIANTIGNLVADAVAGDGKPNAGGRVTALQDVGPVQVGSLDTSALDDLNLQLVLPTDFIAGMSYDGDGQSASMPGGGSGGYYVVGGGDPSAMLGDRTGFAAIPSFGNGLMSQDFAPGLATDRLASLSDTPATAADGSSLPEEFVVTASHPQALSEKSSSSRPKRFNSRAEFFAYAAPYAVRSERQTGVPAAITLAQAAIESANGNRHIGSANNYFGVKAFRNKDGQINFGDIATGYVTVPTREVINGKSIMINDHFRSYESMEDSFTDHGMFLTQNRRYSGILGEYAMNGDTTAFARGLQRAGYATDPNYAKMIVSIINNYNLNKYNGVNSHR
jgi:flagellum-specific peptidoglycan hydrolase FlgJ